MPFTGNEDHHISLSDAAELTKDYRIISSSNAILGSYFSRNAINSILNQQSCVGIRIYYGRTKENKPSLVIVGVNADGNDIYNGEIAEYAHDCPPNCSSPNPLNS